MAKLDTVSTINRATRVSIVGFHDHDQEDPSEWRTLYLPGLWHRGRHLRQRAAFRLFRFALRIGLKSPSIPDEIFSGENQVELSILRRWRLRYVVPSNTHLPNWPGASVAVR